ncbi:hypothetical protein P5G60_09750 [Paenibacillus jamilae]|nr:hypothetical protein [Paenibacillus jamilae]
MFADWETAVELVVADATSVAAAEADKGIARASDKTDTTEAFLMFFILISPLSLIFYPVYFINQPVCIETIRAFMIDKVFTGIYKHLHYKSFIVIIQQKIDFYSMLAEAGI